MTSKQNYELILFVYGLVFFSMGLAVALYSRRSSRLELARSLKWLAAFGLLHGAYEWSDLLIPLQARYLGQQAISLLSNIQLLVLGLSFASLFQFGITLVRPNHHTNWLKWLVPLVLLIWIVVMFGVFLPIAQNHTEWFRLGNALARYGLAFPGSLLAAYGLRKHANEKIPPLHTPRIYDMLRIAGLSLAVYAFFGGLVVPPVTFFPGNWLNTMAFEQIIGFPVVIVRSAISAVLAVTMISALEVFDVETERVIEKMEQQQILVAERERIGRDLHDGLIQKVYSVGLMVESSLNLTDPDGVLHERLQRTLLLVQETIDDARKNLTELRPLPSTEPLSDLLQKLVQDPRYRSLLNIRYDSSLQSSEPDEAVRVHHILAIANEALSNIARHAHADQVLVLAQSNHGIYILSIQDNGLGISDEGRAGHGLRNMRERARLLNGKLEIISPGSHGAMVKLTVPVVDEVGI